MLARRSVGVRAQVSRSSTAATSAIATVARGYRPLAKPLSLDEPSRLRLGERHITQLVRGNSVQLLRHGPIERTEPCFDMGLHKHGAS
jgi:hypothetical protein